MYVNSGIPHVLATILRYLAEMERTQAHATTKAPGAPPTAARAAEVKIASDVKTESGMVTLANKLQPLNSFGTIVVAPFVI